MIRLQECVSESNRAWSKFNSVHGDIAYFSDLTDEVACSAMSKIRDAFEDLDGLGQKLKSMENCFKESAETVSN
jgi:hypothetical protein